MKNIKDFIIEGFNINNSDFKQIVDLVINFGHIVPISTLRLDNKLYKSVVKYIIINTISGYVIAFCTDENELENCFKEISKQISEKAVLEYMIFDGENQKYMKPEEENKLKYKFFDN